MARSCKIKYTQKTHAYHSCKSKVTYNIFVYSPQMRVNLKRALKVKVLKSCTGYVFEVPTWYYHLGQAFVAHIAFTRKIVLEISWKLLILPFFTDVLLISRYLYIKPGPFGAGTLSRHPQEPTDTIKTPLWSLWNTRTPFTRPRTDWFLNDRLLSSLTYFQINLNVKFARKLLKVNKKVISQIIWRNTMKVTKNMPATNAKLISILITI